MKVDHVSRHRGGHDTMDHGRSRHHHHHKHHHRHKSQPPYLEQRETGSSASQSSIPRRPGSAGSIGAWIKSKSTDWYPQMFGAISNYIHPRQKIDGGNHHRSHHRRHRDGDHRKHRSHHRHHHHRSHHHEETGYPIEPQMAIARRHYDEGAHGQNKPRKHRSRHRDHSAAHIEKFEEANEFQTIELEKRRKKKRSSNEVQHRDHVVVVCFIAVNCILIAIGIGAAILAGLAQWNPAAFRSLYSSEVGRIFEDMMELDGLKCGNNFNKFILEPAAVLPGVFNVICFISIGLALVAAFGFVIVALTSRFSKWRTLLVFLHICYILLVIGFTGLIAAYLIMYFQVYIPYIFPVVEMFKTPLLFRVQIK